MLLNYYIVILAYITYTKSLSQKFMYIYAMALLGHRLSPITHLNQYWHLRLQITFIIFDSHIISIQINEIGNEYRFQIKFGAASNIIKRQDIEH